MKKTPTVFDRDWDGNRGVVPRIVTHPGGAEATEKLDGTNVRVTVRNGEPVRLEARKNPSKRQKAQGIAEPWYRDAWHVVDDGEGPCDPADRYVVEALGNTPCDEIPDGEWSAEAVGPKVQGNPLQLVEHRLFFFDRDCLPAEVCVPLLEKVPVIGYPASKEQVEDYFEALREYLRIARSVVNPEVGIEGIVWHGGDGWAKLKRKDYK